MAKIRKRPTDIFRLWRWESEFSLETFDSLGLLFDSNHVYGCGGDEVRA